METAEGLNTLRHRASPASILANIERHAAETPDRVAVIFNDRHLTFGQLVDAAYRLARHFRNSGLRSGCRVDLLALNRPEYYVVYFATLLSGGTFFPINPELSEDEIAYIVARTTPDLLILDDAVSAQHDDIAARRLSDARMIVSLDVLIRESQAAAPAPFEAAPRSPDDIALVVHTSGTTSRAKGVLASDRMEVLSAAALQEVWTLGPHDRSVCALPLSYVFGLFTASYNPLSSGASVVLLDRFHPVKVLQAIETHRATFMVGVPTMFAMMLNHVRETGARYDLSSMRFFAASGAPALDKTKGDFEKRLGHPLLDYYALSECTPIFSFDLRQDDMAARYSGKLVSGVQIRIRDEHGEPVPKGEIGHLSVASERLTPGYFEDEDKTAQAIQDGWFATGDLAREEDDGYYAIVGRTRDQIISGGHKIASAEIEDIILRHPAVANVAVIGEPDDTLGEVVVAVAVLHPSSDIAPEDIQAFCKQHLAQYKIPRKVRFRADLPVSPAGKVLKRQL